MARFTVEWRRIVGYAAVYFMIDYALWTIAPLGLYSAPTLLAAIIWWDVYGLTEDDFPFKDATSIINMVGGVLLNPQQRVNLTNYLQALYKTAGWSLVVMIKSYQLVHDALAPGSSTAVAVLSVLAAALALVTINNLVTSLVPIKVLVELVTGLGSNPPTGSAPTGPGANPRPSGSGDGAGTGVGDGGDDSAPTRPHQPEPNVLGELFKVMAPMLSTSVQPGPGPRRPTTVVESDDDVDDESIVSARRRRKGYEPAVRRRVVKVSADVDDELDAVLEEMD